MGKTRDLTPEQRVMVEAYRLCRNKTESYKKAFDDWEYRVKPENIYKVAHAAFTPLVMAEIKRLDKIDEAAQKKAAQKDAEELRKLWSRRDSVERLIEILDDCQRTREIAAENGDGVPVQAARLERDTVDSLNKMMGYNEPEQHEVDTTITVEFGAGLEEYAV